MDTYETILIGMDDDELLHEHKRNIVLASLYDDEEYGQKRDQTTARLRSLLANGREMTKLAAKAGLLDTITSNGKFISGTEGGIS